MPFMVLRKPHSFQQCIFYSTLLLNVMQEFIVLRNMYVYSKTGVSYPLPYYSTLESAGKIT